MTLTVNQAPFFNTATETLSRKELERMQEARILQLIPYVYNRAPLTRYIWDKAGVKPSDITSLQDYKDKAPFIDKDSIREFRDANGDPFGGLCCATTPHLKGIGSTSGTTGDPTPIARAKYTTSLIDLKRGMWHIGLRPDDYLLYTLFTFREGHIADRYLDSGFKTINLPHSPIDVVPRLIEASLKYRPKVLYMLSTPMVAAIDKYVRDHNVDVEDVFSSYRGAVFGGETLGEAMKERLAGWGLNVFEYSSLGDVCGAMECSAHDGMHTWEDLVLVENLDPDGDQPVGDNEVGELVVTSLTDDVAPLVRFRTDDLVRFTRQPCSCGRTHGRMWPQGRKGDQILVQGKSILPRDILPILQPLKETSQGLFQIVLRSKHAEILELRVAYDPVQSGDLNRLKSMLETHISGEMGVPVVVQLVPDEEMLKLGPPQKIPRVIKP